MNYNTLATKEVLNATMERLSANGFLPEVVNNRVEALEKIKSLIPAEASVMNGSSTTLNQIGFVEHLKMGNHGWNNLHEKVLLEKDPAKQLQLRKEGVLADYFLASAHAITQNGEILIASNSGSQLPSIAFTSANIILVVSTQKIVENLDHAFKRVREYILPLEDARMKSVNMGGSFISKELILYREQSWSSRKFHIIFVNEILGF